MSDFSEVELTTELINLPSITPNDAGCQDLIADLLCRRGFSWERLDYGDVRNSLFHLGETYPMLLFLGHTDVVPTGDVENWKYPPFQATFDGDLLYGRGATDMKSGVAAMVAASCEFTRKYPNFSQEALGSIGILLTSNEEGITEDGAKRVLRSMEEEGKKVDYCVVGEPSSTDKVADTIKYGRRGSASCNLIIHGKQGHVAYPQYANNAIHNGLRAIQKIVAIEWDRGNEHFPPSTLQISNVGGGTGADNVIPGQMTIDFNIRFSTEQTAKSIEKAVKEALSQSNVEYTSKWNVTNAYLSSKNGELIQILQQATRSICGYTPRMSTAGGTSDGRFVSKDTQIAEIGVPNETAHQVNEHVRVSDLTILKQIYLLSLEKIFVI